MHWEFLEARFSPVSLAELGVVFVPPASAVQGDARLVMPVTFHKDLC